MNRIGLNLGGLESVDVEVRCVLLELNVVFVVLRECLVEVELLCKNFLEVLVVVLDKVEEIRVLVVVFLIVRI